MLQRGLDREGGNIRLRRWSDSEVIAQHSQIPGSVVAEVGGEGEGLKSRGEEVTRRGGGQGSGENPEVVKVEALSS